MDASSVTSIGGNAASGNKNSNDALRDLKLDDFLKLMITELQNQDPLDPMSNTEILQQISEIRNVAATSSLTDTLDSVKLGQSLANANGLLDRRIKGLTDAGVAVNGVVDRVSLEKGDVRVHVGDKELGLNNISEIL